MKSNKPAIPHIGIGLSFTVDEHQRLHEMVRQSTARSVNSYVRSVLFEKNDIALKTRNQSMDDFLEGALQLKNELSTIRKSYDIAIKKLLSLQQVEEVQQWVAAHMHLQQEIAKKTREICLKMDQIYQLCLQG